MGSSPGSRATLSAAERPVVWLPQQGSQVSFLESPLFEVLYEGTRGPGKTDALLMDFAQHCGIGLGASWRGVLFRQTYKQLSDAVSKSKRFLRLFEGVSWNKADMTWTWPDGEQLLLRYMRDVDDYEHYHGHEYPWIGFEELTSWPTPDVYTRMMSCCRSSDPRVPRHYRATTNPYGVGHNWVKERFQLPQMRGVVIREHGSPPRVAVHGTLRENQILLASEPDYEDRIREAARNPAEAEAWLHGSWHIQAGGMFDDVWDPGVHVVDPFPIPHGWRVDRAFDWGSSRPFSVGWYAESNGESPVDLETGAPLFHTVRGDVFRIAELYGCVRGSANVGLRMTAREVAIAIRERELQLGLSGRVKAGPADSAIWDDTNGNSIASDMQAAKVTWERADKGPGSRVQGWAQCRQKLKNGIPPEHGVRELPGFFVWRGHNEHFLRTFPVLPRDDRNLDDVDTDAEDHIGDEVRYRLRRKPAPRIRTREYTF